MVSCSTQCECDLNLWGRHRNPHSNGHCVSLLRAPAHVDWYGGFYDQRGCSVVSVAPHPRRVTVIKNLFSRWLHMQEAHPDSHLMIQPASNNLHQMLPLLYCA